ncbi:hypothetical protein VSK70_26670 [Bacillus sp. WOD8 KX774193]|nr:hypothetical protein [Bacillus sp. WOD8 KX774193]
MEAKPREERCDNVLKKSTGCPTIAKVGLGYNKRFPIYACI